MKTSLKLTSKSVAKLVRDQLEKHQESDFRLELKRVVRSRDGWWRALVLPDREVRAECYVKRLVDVEEELQDGHHVKIVLLPVLIDD